ALETAATAVRAAGFEDCSEDQLAALVEALAADTGRVLGGPCGASLAIELHEALDPLAPHIAPRGREGLLLHTATLYPAAAAPPLSRCVSVTVSWRDEIRWLAAARPPSLRSLRGAVLMVLMVLVEPSASPSEPRPYARRSPRSHAPRSPRSHAPRTAALMLPG